LVADNVDLKEIGLFWAGLFRTFPALPCHAGIMICWFVTISDFIISRLLFLKRKNFKGPQKGFLNFLKRAPLGDTNKTRVTPSCKFQKATIYLAFSFHHWERYSCSSETKSSDNAHLRSASQSSLFQGFVFTFTRVEKPLFSQVNG